MLFPPYIVFCAENVSRLARGSGGSVLITNCTQPSDVPHPPGAAYTAPAAALIALARLFAIDAGVPDLRLIAARQAYRLRATRKSRMTTGRQCPTPPPRLEHRLSRMPLAR